MKLHGTPEQALAVAVLERAVRELRKGSPERKAQARYDILEGGLDVWVEVACDGLEDGGYIRSELRKMAQK